MAVPKQIIRRSLKKIFALKMSLHCRLDNKKKTWLAGRTLKLDDIFHTDYRSRMRKEKWGVAHIYVPASLLHHVYRCWAVWRRRSRMLVTNNAPVAHTDKNATAAITLSACLPNFSSTTCTLRLVILQRRFTQLFYYRAHANEWLTTTTGCFAVYASFLSLQPSPHLQNANHSRGQSPPRLGPVCNNM